MASDTQDYSETSKALYAGLNRTAFGVGVALVIYLAILKPDKRTGPVSLAL